MKKRDVFDLAIFFSQKKKKVVQGNFCFSSHNSDLICRVLDDDIDPFFLLTLEHLSSFPQNYKQYLHIYTYI